MAVYDLFSKRQQRLRGEIFDVYSYEHISGTLRNQIIHIWIDSLGSYNLYGVGRVREVYNLIVDVLRREYGVFILPGNNQFHNNDNSVEELVNYFLYEEDVEKILDVIELSFIQIDEKTRQFNYLCRQDASKIADSAIEELNIRFKENGVGYQFHSREIIRVDSEFIHSEVVKPALKLLNQELYAGAQEEFLRAHEHYRKGNAKEALNECLKSFESFMKSICDKRCWAYAENATSRNLIQTCFDNGLIPSFWQQNLTSLRSLLESSVPTGRNKMAGHGQGATATVVPDYLVAYMLHMTASVLVFLGEAETALP